MLGLWPSLYVRHLSVPKLNQKKVITLKAKMSQECYKEVEVNPSIRLTEVQRLVDEFANEMIRSSVPGTTVEVTAEGLV